VKRYYARTAPSSEGLWGSTSLCTSRSSCSGGRSCSRRKVCCPWRPSALPDGTRSASLSSQIHAVAWILLALGYTYSGCTKLASPSWLDGTALARILDTLLARPGVLREALMLLPPLLLKLATWGTLGLEVVFAPLALVPCLRPYLWSAALALHVALIVLIDFADLSVGMVVFHFFTLDPAWITASRPQKERQSGGLCTKQFPAAHAVVG
jgi:hypothetical protein